MKPWKPRLFESLLLDSKDGEWGAGQETVGSREALIVRGTDFADLDNPGAEIPRRWIKDHIVDRKRLAADDIILETAGGTSSQSTGRSALVTRSLLESHADVPVLCASFSRHLRLKPDYSPRFIYYLLQTLYRSGYMSVFNIQHTGVSRFQYTSFKTHAELLIPDLSIQRKIAAVLSAYDELVRNIKRRVAALEQIAEEIYREWFVRLRFPGYSAARMVKGVPTGWTRTTVGSMTSYLKRGVAPYYDETASGIAINQKCIRNGKVDLTVARRQSREVSTERHVRCGDVLINSTGEGTLGRVGQLLFSVPNCIVDSHVTIVRPKEGVSIHYFGMMLKAWEPHFTIMGRGATNQTELAPSVIGRVCAMVPPEPIQRSFERLAAPIFEQISNLSQQREHLERTRDLFLPRLTSGDLTVEDLDIQCPPDMAEEFNAECSSPVHA